MAKLIFYDFLCENGHAFEALVPTGTEEHECEKCGAKAQRQLSAPTVSLEGFSGSFPGAYYRWATKRAEKAIQEAKRNPEATWD